MKVISLISPANPHYTTRKTELLISINIDPNNLYVYIPFEKRLYICQTW